MAGQGFNVGLRDAESLANCIASSAPNQDEKMLADYRVSRQTDTKNGLLFTDFLVNIFSNDIVGVSGLRSIGLGVFDMVKPIKAHLVSKSSFGKMADHLQKDVVIVGAGLVGLSAAVALHQAGYSVVLVDRQNPTKLASTDSYAWISIIYAVSPRNAQWLATLVFWNLVAARASL